MEDALDVAVVNGLLGGLVGAGVNWAARGSPRMTRSDAVKYVLLFSSMGVLSGAIIYGALPQSSPSVFVGGSAVLSFVFLGIGNYL